MPPTMPSLNGACATLPGDLAPHIKVVRTFETGATRDSDSNKPDYVGFVSHSGLQKLDDWVLRERDLAWAGGIFEGEGYIGQRPSPELQVKMCDEDTLRRFAAIMAVGKVYGPYQVKATALHRPKRPWRPYFSWQVRGDGAIAAAKSLYPYLGSRRRATMREKWGVERLAIVAGMPPVVLKRFGEYMMKHQIQPDGNTRASDNWKRGIPFNAYMASLYRHVQDVALHHTGESTVRDSLEDALCAVLFNAMGYLHEWLKRQKDAASDAEALTQEQKSLAVRRSLDAASPLARQYTPHTERS